MFLHLSVIHSVHRGEDVYPSMQWAGRCVSGDAMGGSASGSRGCTPLGWPPADTPLGRHSPETATEAGGTHPTAMHSC